MYISVSQASEKLNIPTGKLQALCRKGKVKGAKKEGGFWMIPERISPSDVLSAKVASTASTAEMDMDQLCSFLSISKATAKNWLRLGKIQSKSNGNFDLQYARLLKEQISQGKFHALKSRRNKKHVVGSKLYESYISHSENHRIIKRFFIDNETLCNSPDFDSSQMRTVLAAFALEIYLQAKGLTESEKQKMNLDTIRKTDSVFSLLIDDLLCSQDAGSFLSPDIALQEYTQKIKFVPGEDTLGFIYLSLRTLVERKISGSYFTPETVADKLVSELGKTADLSNKTICDPCCGSGMFLNKLALAGVPLKNLYGRDLDQISIQLARINMYLLWLAEDFQNSHRASLHICEKNLPDFLYSHFTVCDSLLTSETGKYDVIIGNPPWGSDMSKDYIKKLEKFLETAKSGSCESSSFFLEKSIKTLPTGGLLAFVLPESLLSVRSHKGIRRIMLQGTAFKYVHYLENVFSGVQCPAVILILEKTRNAGTSGCRVFYKTSYVIEKERQMTCESFSFNVNDKEYACLKAIDSVDCARYLGGNSKFALGMVTGDNEKYISSVKSEYNEPVLRGSSILRYSIAEPDEFITFHPEKFQQVAPEQLYRAKEKLLYRFICRVPVFALDCNQTLSLNSCNVLVPEIQGLDTKYVLGILNSSLAAFYLGKRFDSIKLLRSHIESLPIPWISSEKQGPIIELVEEIIGSSGARKLELYNELDEMIGKLYGLDEARMELVRKYAEEGNLFIG